MRNSKTFLLSSTFNAFILIFTFFVALIYIEDIYNDYYDDVNDKLICTRLLSIDSNQIIK